MNVRTEAAFAFICVYSKEKKLEVTLLLKNLNQISQPWQKQSTLDRLSKSGKEKGSYGMSAM